MSFINARNHNASIKCGKYSNKVCTYVFRRLPDCTVVAKVKAGVVSSSRFVAFFVVEFTGGLVLVVGAIVGVVIDVVVGVFDMVVGVVVGSDFGVVVVVGIVDGMVVAVVVCVVVGLVVVGAVVVDDVSVLVGFVVVGTIVADVDVGVVPEVCVEVGVVNWHLLPIFTNPVLQTQAITPVDVSLQSDLGPHGWTPSAHGLSANKIHTL